LPQGRAIAQLLPNARLQVLDGTGHIPAIEDPTGFNDALLAFLRANRRGAQGTAQ
jgi:pimeloyl-ACP methyl ester carboxylesterase